MCARRNVVSSFTLLFRVIQNSADSKARYPSHLAFHMRVHANDDVNDEHSELHQALSDIPRKIMPLATGEKADGKQ